MRWIAILALGALVVSGCALLDADESDESVTVGSVVVSMQIGDEVRLHGEVALLGELFCPCFNVSDGEATVVVWYDLMVDDAGEFPAVSIAEIGNGDEVVVIGEYRSTDPGTGFPVIWAEEVVSR
jgi:hypothetical protein